MKKLLLLVALSLLVAPIAFAAGKPEVKRAVLCTSVVDREPTAAVESIPVGEQVIFFFNEIVDGAGSNISHRWLYNDIEMATVPLKVGADRWRTWSSKQVWHLLPGVLKVQVVDESGTVLSEQSLTITAKEG